MVAKSAKDLQTMLDVVSVYYKKWRVALNLGKTQIVVFGVRVSNALDIRYRGQRVQVSDSYKYLGMWFQSNGSWDKEKKSRIKKAKRRMAVAYNMLIRAGKLSVQDGLAVWRGLIRPVLELAVKSGAQTGIMCGLRRRSCRKRCLKGFCDAQTGCRQM